jgi:hypothetical protein
VNGALAISGLLTQSAGLKAIVAARIYPDVMPETPVYPSVTFQRMSGSSERGSTSDPPLKSAVYQVSAWAKNRPAASEIAAQIRGALDRKRKVIIDGVQVDDCFYQDDIDLFDFETRTYFTHLTFKIFYRDPL